MRTFTIGLVFGFLLYFEPSHQIDAPFIVAFTALLMMLLGSLMAIKQDINELKK